MKLYQQGSNSIERIEARYMEKYYKKIKSLGKGATAEVFLVEETATGKYYAMKTGGQGELLKWEAELLGSLQCDAFPAVKEYVKKNREYLVMEYIEGMSLQELLDKEKRLEQGEILHIMVGILRALDKLHRHVPGIIYRDLKPANVMIDVTGRIRLIDLGAACYEDGTFGMTGISAGTTLAGTYGYAAPEQFWQGVIPDITCDIYAAGKVFAYMLSGKSPAEPPYDVEHICRGVKHVPPACLEILERSMTPQPQARYADCESMYRDICRAFTEKTNKKRKIIREKRTCCYKKCIWKSEYQRIF